MKIAPSATRTLRYPALLATAALLALTGCTTCPACNGAGLQVYTEYGPLSPNFALGKSYRSMNSAPCMHCFGKGRRPIWEQAQAPAPRSNTH